VCPLCILTDRDYLECIVPKPNDFDHVCNVHHIEPTDDLAVIEKRRQLLADVENDSDDKQAALVGSLENINKLTPRQASNGF